MATSGDANKKRKYDVFLNHRGPDVKKTIASSLYRWLTSRSPGLQVFLDSQELEAGQNLDTQIKEAIASASLHVAIFSPRYAQSVWCLEELRLMFESNKPIIPIFYKVQPTDLRSAQGHKGAYAEDLDKHESKKAWDGQPRHNSSTVLSWRNALFSAAEISGFDLDTFNGDEGELLDKVVKCALKSVKKPHLLDVCKYPVGLDEKAQDFHRKVLSQQHGGRRVQVVGIAGPQGVGKTTLARELFNRNCSNYNYSYFLSDVKENSKSSLPSLQKKILKGLIQLDLGVDNVDEGRRMLKEHLSNCRVLLVLDDVDDADHVDALLPVDVLHPESLVLITSRSKNVLKWSGMQEHSIYQLSGLDEHHSRELFCYYAFGQPRPKSEFEDLVIQFLKACNGVPVCLKEHGRHVIDNNNKSDWEDQLKKLLSTRHTDSRRSFQISYEIWNISYRMVDTVNTIGMRDQLRALRGILLKYLGLVTRPWHGIGKFNGGTEEFNGGVEEFTDLSHDMKGLQMIVLKANVDCPGCKRKMMQIIACVEGVESIAVDYEKMKLTVIGSLDPVNLMATLRRKGRHSELLSVGPAREIRRSE